MPSIKATVGFYNLENLFDTKDDIQTRDDDFTKDGYKNWNSSRYFSKIKKLSNTISQIGNQNSESGPDLVGVAEIENTTVLRDLVNAENLLKRKYNYVHFDSPDERGIDVALLFKMDSFSVIKAEKIPLFIENEFGERDFTRDHLYVVGSLHGDLVHIIINHWPSRRDGAISTEKNRIKAAENVLNLIQEIRKNEEDPKIIVMGDFNDNPIDKSLSLLCKNQLHNPMLAIFKAGKGTLQYNMQWNLFDQILLSYNFINNKATTFQLKDADIYNPEYLKVYKGKYKGSPFRTYVGKYYKGGYSDHFPVFVNIEK